MKFKKHQVDEGGKQLSPQVLKSLSKKQLKQYAEKHGIYVPNDLVDKKEIVEHIIRNREDNLFDYWSR